MVSVFFVFTISLRGGSGLLAFQKRRTLDKGAQPPLGFLLTRLNVPVTVLARYLHVDASLVSKWKNGRRKILEYSDHCELILDFFTDNREERFSDLFVRLRELLREVSPLQALETKEAVRAHLKSFLLERPFVDHLPAVVLGASRAACTAKVLIYRGGGAGRREAVSELLGIAEEMTSPGELAFIECEQFRWLLEDLEYARQWGMRIYRLLERGFHARFIVHLSVYNEPFYRFFSVCNSLLFHRNIDWYYHEHYDSDFHWFSFFILGHACSVMGLSMEAKHCDTTMFTDALSIAQHKRVVEAVQEASRPLFVDFHQGRLLPSLGDLLKDAWRDGPMFTFLPVPVFAATDPDLLKEVLLENGVSSAKIRHCLKENRHLSHIIDRQLQMSAPSPVKMITIYQLEEMQHRLEDGGFESCSLTLMTGQSIRVSLSQYARGLLHVVRKMEMSSKFHIVLASEEDHNQLPGLNCWCKDKEWMIQMDSHGIRFCREDAMVRAASVALERCLRKIPPARKDQTLVKQMLLQIASDMRDRMGAV